MEQPPPSPSPSPVPPSVPATGIEISDGLSPPAVWDWGNFLDFAMEADNGLIMQWDSPDIPHLPSPRPPLSKVASPPDPEPVILPVAGSSNRVRKRDPRLVCENYLAGRVPCACPEVDEKEFEVDEEEQQIGGRKRARAGVVNVRLRCQVRGCEEDISELKGYHRRHRVCLRCANALSVIHDGEEKRYCQQCGKFHVLLDFDDDKHSCRRKLERHNRRRRKKTSDSDRAEKENLLQGEPTEVSEETPKESGWQVAENGARDKISDGDSFLHSECGNGYPSFSSTGLVQAQTKSLSFTASVDTHIVDRIDNQKPGISPTICDNRTFYSSVSPTGRISFKLYDWNPAEFPRRLRHQIFQWLASMPVELEGYIRPGCTILTIFIAMPHNMWEKLHQDGDLFIKQLVNSSESLFWGRGNILIYLSDMVVHVLKDGTSFIKMEVEAPRLHYVHPMYFEAGKGLEFIVCGSNLDRPKLRFLVSFAGKYLLCDNYRVISHQDVWCDGKNSVVSSNSHGREMFQIKIKQTQSDSFGPAFIEVENESGISNFIPILIGDKEICSELENLGGSFCYRSSGAEDKCGSNAAFTNTTFNKVTVARHIDMTDLLLDIAWMLKKPCQDCYESFFGSLNVQRINNLLQFSLQNELISVLKAVLKYAAIVFHETGFQNFKSWTVGADLVQLLQNMETARKFINQRTLQMGSTMLVSGHSSYLEAFPAIYVENELFIMNHTNQVEGSCLPALASPPLPSVNSDEGASHVPEDVSCSEISFRCFSSSYWPTNMPSPVPVSRRWHTVFVLCTCAICFLLCIILLNPHKASDFVIYMGRYPFTS